MKHEFDSLWKMKGLILILFCGLTFVTVVSGENNFNFFYLFNYYLKVSFGNMSLDFIFSSRTPSQTLTTSYVK